MLPDAERRADYDRFGPASGTVASERGGRGAAPFGGHARRDGRRVYVNTRRFSGGGSGGAGNADFAGVGGGFGEVDLENLLRGVFSKRRGPGARGRRARTGRLRSS